MELCPKPRQWRRPYSRADIVKEINKEIIDITVAKIDAKLSGNEKASSKAKAKLSYIENNFTANLEKYEKQETVLVEGNSYTKSDTQTAFMRMKEDHTLNGQLKLAYNTRISKQNQIILYYAINQNPIDTKTLKPHLENFEHTFGKKVFKNL